MPTPHSRTARLITRVAGMAAGLFYRVERHGPDFPQGPLLVAANHPNSLLDPLLIFLCSERLTRSLARAPLFDRPLLGPLLRAVGAIPVHRRQDDPAAMHRNEDTFRAAVKVLSQGGAIQIFPEGRSHSGSRLAEFRTGAARIALRAEAGAGWRLGLAIVPVGITYSRKQRARTEVAVRFGRGFGCADLREAYREDPVAAARALTERMEAAVRARTLNFLRHEDRELVEVAERLYVRESRWVPWRGRESLGRRLPRLQRFAAGLEWLRIEAPEEHRELRRKVADYATLSVRVGAGQGDVPSRYGLAPVARYVVSRGTVLLLGFPFALVGAVLWVPVTRLAGFVVRRLRPDSEVRATYKLAALLGGVAAAWMLWAFLGYVLGGPVLALGVAAAAPPCGYVAIRWVELAREVKEDTVLFLKLQGRPDLRMRFARLRGELAEAFRRLEQCWEAGAPGSPDPDAGTSGLAEGGRGVEG